MDFAKCDRCGIDRRSGPEFKPPKGWWFINGSCGAGDSSQEWDCDICDECWSDVTEFLTKSTADLRGT